MVQERLPLEEMTLRQLRKVASELGISRYSRMRKAQLLTAIITYLSLVEVQHWICVMVIVAHMMFFLLYYPTERLYLEITLLM